MINQGILFAVVARLALCDIPLSVGWRIVSLYNPVQIVHAGGKYKLNRCLLAKVYSEPFNLKLHRPVKFYLSAILSFGKNTETVHFI